MNHTVGFTACLLTMLALAVFGGPSGLIAVAIFAAPILFLLPLYGGLALQRAGKGKRR